MAAQKHPQGLLYLPSRKVDSHAWHQPGTSSAQQGVDRGHSSAAAPGCMGLSKLWEIVKDRVALHAAVWFKESDATY